MSILTNIFLNEAYGKLETLKTSVTDRGETLNNSYTVASFGLNPYSMLYSIATDDSKMLEDTVTLSIAQEALPEDTATAYKKYMELFTDTIDTYKGLSDVSSPNGLLNASTDLVFISADIEELVTTLDDLKTIYSIDTIPSEYLTEYGIKL